MIPFAKPMIGPEEKAAVLKAMDSPRLTEGPLVEEFERAFGEMHGGHAVAVSSCTAALKLCARFIGKPTELTAMTHVATAAIMWPEHIMFRDCDSNGHCPTTGISVSFLGAPCFPADIQDLATAVGLERCGRFCCYSFYPSKHMTTGEGGMIVCRNEYDASQLKRDRAFGKTTVDGSFDVISHGLNFRMSEIQAAIGIEQLKKLPGWLETRKRNWHEMAERLPHDLRVLDTSGGSYYALSAYVPDGVDRDAYRTRLGKAGIETSIYYPVPVPHLTYYKEKYGHKWGEFPNAERIATRSVCFPVGPHIGEREMDTICKAAKECL